MSATNRGGKRDKLDRYYTPDVFARACVARMTIPEGATVLEPSVGGGAFVRAVLAATRGTADIAAVDMDPDADGFTLCDEITIGDFLDYADLLANPGYDLVIGNPPYAFAADHVRAALKCAPRVGFLLRLNFLESQKRAQLWKDTPLAAVHVFSCRPSFTGGGSDATGYAFFVWDKAHKGPPSLHWVFPSDLG